MKRELKEDNISENNEQNLKKFKQGDIILINENLNIKYYIESKREIFIRHFAEMKCPFCQKEITQFISIGYDKDPELIEFCLW
jgi:hypothetical protein